MLARGFEIVALNLRVGRLELDIVARRADLVVVVEVRTRGSGAWSTGFGSMDARKRQRVRRAGEWLWQRRYCHDCSVTRLRFDAASVVFGPTGVRVDYAPAAF